MSEWQGKVAVITGGASGIGRAMAERFAEEGMKIVLADVEIEALHRAEAEMQAEGAEVMAVRCDVSKAHDVKELAQKAVDAFDSVHILCNNAGVSMGGPTWEIDLEDWEWVLGVNLWGVIHGIHYFMPIMLNSGVPCHIVNTSSMCGLTTGRNITPYYVSKHGVVALSESLHKELADRDDNIHVSVLCPGFVETKIHESDRNRPSGPIDRTQYTDLQLQSREMALDKIRNGLPPHQIAQKVFEGIQNRAFYIFPHEELKEYVKIRMHDVLEDREPTIMSSFIDD